MQLKVKLFAGLAEQIGKREVEITVEAPATAASLRSALAAAYPACAKLIARAIFARNQEYAKENDEVAPTDEIGLIPPVGGGSPSDDFRRRITDEPLDVLTAFKLLENVCHGGTVIFCGTVREWTQNRQTHHLCYEAYVQMALAQMQTIENEVKQKWPDVETLQWHRVGRLEPSDVAVICAASAAHRNDAFEAARELIERLKKQVPIWKKEHYSDGEATWQPNETE